MGVTYSNGFVFKSKRSKHWRMAVDRVDEDGTTKRLLKTSTVPCSPDTKHDDGSVKQNARGKALAEQALRAWRDELVAKADDRVWSEAQFYEYAKEYVSKKERTKSVSHQTATGYSAILKQLNGTRLGRCRISHITADIISEFMEELLENGLSTTTANKAHVFLKSVCREAVRRGDLPGNPFDLVNPPRRHPKPVNSLTKDGLSRLNAKLAEAADDPVCVAARLALMTGMRQGEICALRWVDIDLKERVLRVDHSLVRVKGSYEMSVPKTPKSRRLIPFGESLAATLRDRKARMKFDAADAGLGWDDRAFVLGTPDGRWMNPYYLGQQWSSFARFNDVRGTQGEQVRFHDLRHTFATLSIMGGVDVKTVSVILGHASAAMTLDIYADALEDSKRAGMELMDSILST